MSKRKKSSRSCKLDLSDSCFSRISAKCVDYEGTLSEYSELDPESNCLDIEEVIEDLSNIVDDIKDAIDVSELGCCLTYTPSDEEKGLVIKDVVSAHEGLICELLDDVAELKENCGGNSNCSNGVDECGNPIDCCDILKKYAFSTQIVFLPDSGVWVDSMTFVSSDLFYKLEKKGVYKVNVEVEYSTESVIKVGLSVNNNIPQPNPFAFTTLSTSNPVVQQHSNTTFIYDGIKGDMLTLKFARTNTDSEIVQVKMIIEKVK